MKEALEDMVYQFGYRTIHNNKPCISTGGLSALEEAFSALGWSDPYILPEEGNTCEIKGCMYHSTAGMPWEDMYLRLCHKHTSMVFNKKKRPPVKDYAVLRESKRDKQTGILSL